MSPIDYKQLDREANISMDDFYTKLDQEAVGPIGIRETLKHVDMLDVLEHIPVPFNPYAGAEKVGYVQAKERLAKSNYAKYGQERWEMTPMGGYTMVQPRITRADDIAYIKQHEDWEREKTTRGVTWGQSVAHGILDVFPWIADIAISGGARKSVTAAISKAVKSPKLATGAALLANALVASSMQPSRFSETAADVKIQYPDLPKSEVYTKAVKRLYIENLSEMTGQYITKGALKLGKKVPFTNKLIEKTGTAWRKMFNKSVDDFLKKISTTTGVNDLFGEVGEERVNTVLQAIVDADDFGAGKDAGLLERVYAGLKQDAAGLGVEIPILMIPTAGRYVAAKALAPPAIKEPTGKTTEEITQAMEQPPAPAEGGVKPPTVKIGKAFHGTSSIHAEGIKKKGFLPSDVHGLPTATVQKGGVSFTTKKKVADDFSEAVSNFTKGSQPEVIERDFSNLKIFPDPKEEWLGHNNFEDFTDELKKQGFDGVQISDEGEFEVFVFNESLSKLQAQPPAQPAAERGVNFERQTERDIGYDYVNPQKIRQSHEPDVRKFGDNVEDYIEEIKETGTTKPIKVTRMKDGVYEVVDGNNRLEAYRRLNKKIPVIFEKPYKDTGWTGKNVLPKTATLYKPVTEAQAMSKKKYMTRKKGFAIGHDVPEILGWDEDQRRSFMKETIGVESMKDIPKGKKGLGMLRTLADALDQKMQERGLTYEAPTLPTEELIKTLERTKEVTAEDPIRAMNRRGISKLSDTAKKKTHTIGGLFVRMERFFEGLDGHKEGVFYDTFWTPVNDACNSVDSIVNQEVGVFYSEVENQDIDTVQWMGVKEKVSGTDIELTASQRIGIYTLSQNKNGMRYLKDGMGLTAENIAAITEQMSDQETRMAEWLLDKYEAQWPILQVAAAQAGIDLKTLKKEFRYAPIIRTDVDLEQQEDFLSDLAEPFRKESHDPEAGMIKERKKDAIGQIELDAFVVYLHNIARVQRFVTMAPLANKLSKILNNKNFKRTLNDRTYGQGSRLINSWLKDSVKGSSAESTTFLSKTLAIMRINGIVYAIGYNIPSSLRQTLSGLTAIAVDPLMMKHMPMNVLKAMTPKGYRTMEAFVYDKAPELRHRNMDRDIRRKWNKVTLKRNLTYTTFSKRMKKIFGAAAEGDLKAVYMHYKSGKPFSQSALRWIKFMDKHTVVASWKSFYDTAIEKGKSEEDAIHFANKYIGRTQPMGNVQHLPQFFRDGPLEKLISTFNNFINQYGNFYYYDIYQAKKVGDIGMGTVAHRVMWSYVLPAILFGMIGRARLPKDWKEIGIDLGTYPIMPLMIIGRLIDRMIRGWGNSGTIATVGVEAAVGAGRAAIRGDAMKAIKEATKAIAAFKGVPPTAQMIRTAEGAIDLAAGTTQDPRRLIYSKWALEQGKGPTPPARGRYRARRVRPRRAGTRR